MNGCEINTPTLCASFNFQVNRENTDLIQQFTFISASELMPKALMTVTTMLVWKMNIFFCCSSFQFNLKAWIKLMKVRRAGTQCIF